MVKVPAAVRPWTFMRSGVGLWSAALVACALSSGCLVLTVVNTSHEEISRSMVDTRATDHQADVSGQRCFIEQKTRVVAKVHMHGEYPAFGLLEALIGTFPAFDDNVSTNYRYGGYAMIADGLLAAAWTLIHNQAVVTSDDWTLTNDTGSCAK